MKSRTTLGACLLIAMVFTGTTSAADDVPPPETLLQLGTCGPATHPAVPMTVIPGAGQSYAVIYQFHGLGSGSAYASWFMESNTATNEFEDWGIAFGAYDVDTGGYDAGNGQTGSTSGSCLYLGSMPTSRWYIDVLGGGGGFTTSNSCTHETWWEAEVGGSVGYGFGSGFELEANGRFAWGGGDSCTNGAEYDSGVLISTSAWPVVGPCLTECLQVIQASAPQGPQTHSSASPRDQTHSSASPRETLDSSDLQVSCTGKPEVPVSGKIVDSKGTVWQLRQVYDPLDDTTNVWVYYENPLFRDSSAESPFEESGSNPELYFGGTLANVNSGTKMWFSSGSQETGYLGCFYARTAVFGYFDFDILAAHGKGGCDATAGFYSSTGPGDTRNKHDRLWIGLDDPTEPGFVKIGYNGAGDCTTDTYDSTVTLDWAGPASVP